MTAGYGLILNYGIRSKDLSLVKWASMKIID